MYGPAKIHFRCCSAFAQVCAAATCSDGVKNGKETGVDCGGSCKSCKARRKPTVPPRAVATVHTLVRASVCCPLHNPLNSLPGMKYLSTTCTENSREHMLLLTRRTEPLLR